MTATQADTVAEFQRTIAELRQQLAERTTELAQRNSEYGERLEHQAATIDVLKAMSASPGDPQPVFDLIVDRARDLCDAYGATVFEFDGTRIHWRAATGVSDDPAVRAAYEAQFPMAPTRGWAFGRAILDRRIIRIDDMESEPGLDPTLRGITAKSNVTTPIMRGDAVVGAIGMGSREKGGFSDSQVELLKTFAEQAAIAITSAETYRALQARTSDLQETLEYQTATSDVLKVISRSTFDLQPVLDTLLETVARLCSANVGLIMSKEGDGLRVTATFSTTPEYETYVRDRFVPLTRGSLAGRASIERKAVQLSDLSADPDYTVAEAVTLGKVRTAMAVPLLREGEVIGAISLGRQRVEPFTDRQVDLVSTFADQAVIAIENARLLTEQREALEQQTATAEVLQVINSSPANLAPVFEAMLEKALNLCNSAYGSLNLYDGEYFNTAAVRGVPAVADYMRNRGPSRPAGRTSMHRISLGENLVHILDAAADEAYGKGDATRRTLVDLGGLRTLISIALRKDETLLGAISIYRQEIRAFSDKEIALLQNFAAQAVIAIENTRLITEQREALEQQTATAEVLQVINANPGNLAPVFDTMLERALHLCESAFGVLATYDGEVFHHVAVQGVTPELAEFMRKPLSPVPGMALHRVLQGVDVVHTVDIVDDDAYRKGIPARRMLADLGGARTQLLVALRKDDILLGVLNIFRQEVRAFSDRQIALLQNFAAQAVIAMENARLITEQREALEQQTATAEVLQVINSSPGDLTPVFDALLEKAMRLCGAAFGSLYTYDGERFHSAAQRGVPPAYAAYRAEHPPLPSGSGPAILLETRQPMHVLDVRVQLGDWSNSPSGRAMVELGGIRTILGVPLIKDDVFLGFITIFRQEVHAFSDKQIALLENFAAQAVIAMENARLLTETREALEQQTATAEVLGVINWSPGNLAPVFDAILEKAHGLCGIAMGSLELYDGHRFRAVAVRGLSDAFADMLRQGYPASENPATGLLIDGGRLTHIRDLAETDYAITRSGAELDAARTLLCVPLRREGTLLGMIASARNEVRPFSDKEIALLENFAAQAVIAMENARLMTETREALEQQTATAEVLQVINASPGDLTPVFNAVLERALRLCGALFGTLLTYDGERLERVAFLGVPPPFIEYDQQNPLTKNAALVAQGIATGKTVQAADIMTDARMAASRSVRDALIELGGVRALLQVPLVKDGAVVGFIAVWRREPGVFPDKQIALVEGFAAQAVIAMENARLLTEQREALEQQTATAEVLQVINASPGDLAPVFEAILERAMRLCEADIGNFWTYDGEGFAPAVMRGARKEHTEWARQRPRRGGPGSISAQLIEGDDLIHIPDAADTDAYRAGDATRRAMVDLNGGRTLLAVALRKNAQLLGYITVYRREVRPFTDKKIAHLQNFAAQAVIAMENARLLTEQREELERQTAFADVLQTINASGGNLTPVFDAILENAMRLCQTQVGTFWLIDDEGMVRIGAARGWPPAAAERYARPVRASLDTIIGRIAFGGEAMHIADLKDTDAYRAGDPMRRVTVDEVGIRTLYGVPLVKDGITLGALLVGRSEIRSLTDKEMAILRDFANQAVIAIDNARLLNQIRQRQEELRITFENMGDGVALFDETRHLVASNQRFQHMLDVPDDVIASRPTFSDYIRYLADHGEYGPEPEDHVQQLLALGSQRRTFERTRPNGRIIEIRVNPVPGGGFVVIYSDITERKRSEEEIRAARDAAEEASRTIEAAYRDLKAAQASLIQAEKMASLGQLTAGIAHEIKNPLNFVNNFAELSGDLLDELNDAVAGNRQAEIDELRVTLQANLAKITEHGRRADGIVKAMLEHSRGSSGERRMVDLNALIDEALNLAYHGARAQDQSFNITLERNFAEGIAPIELAPQDMTRVFLNLFSNGFYAATRRARNSADAGFMPTLKVTTIDAGEAVEIHVRDNGIGIPIDIRDKLFQPFFTTKPTGEGTGLGLSISYDIVTQQHGGNVAVDSKVGEYSEFTIRLPRNS
jgi:GAF domain-containing protein/nitrogen-specific signal transduction histidine kinase